MYHFNLNRHICLKKGSLCSFCLEQGECLLTLLCPATCYYDRRPFTSECKRCGLPNAGPSASNKDDFPCKPSHVSHLSCLAILTAPKYDPNFFGSYLYIIPNFFALS